MCSTWRVTGVERVREVHVIETHVIERREARARSGRAVVDALQGSRDSFPVFLFIWVIVQMLVGRRLSGDTIEQYKCCRVSAYPDIFLYCIVFRLLINTCIAVH